MDFEKNYKRIVWGSFFTSLIPDLFIALVASLIIQKGLLGFLAIFGGLQLLYIVIWIKNSVWGWIVFWMWGKKARAKMYLDLLQENEFPEPDYEDTPLLTYFGDIAEADDASTDMRMAAAGVIAGHHRRAAAGEMQTGLQEVLVWQSAIKQYKGTFERGSDSPSETT